MMAFPSVNFVRSIQRAELIVFRCYVQIAWRLFASSPHFKENTVSITMPTVTAPHTVSITMPTVTAPDAVCLSNFLLRLLFQHGILYAPLLSLLLT
jgi:hypothetical protein